MRQRRAPAAAALALAVASAGAAPRPDAALRAGRQTPPDRAAWLVVGWNGGEPAAGGHEQRLRTPVRPGSFMKLPALVAALDAGTISADTRVPCHGETTIDGRVIRCSHPRMRHAVRPAEALALSCNVFFATIGRRLPRARFDAVLAALGLPPSPPGAPMFLAATGLEAAPVPAERLATALVRLLRGSDAVRMDPAHRRVVIEGLRGSAVYGTAAAFAEGGVPALAKTGTADAPVEGLVVAAWPADAPAHAIVLVAPGASGSQAAALAAGIAAATTPERTSRAGAGPDSTPSAGARAMTLRVGVPTRAGGYDIRTLELEDYVAQVLAGEAVAASPPAALEALAITVRTFALANRGRHRRDGFDLCTLTHCQVVRRPDAAARRAAAATAGQVLSWQGRPAAVYYTASCGGHTERPSAVWAGADDPPFLPAQKDEACNGEPRWASEIPASDLERALRAAGVRGGPLRDVRRVGRTVSGRVARVAVRGMAPEVVTGQDFRRIVGGTLGWHLVKSTDFEVRRTGAGYRFEGRGFGHGVGLCVIGMTNRARQGERRVERLLRPYYPGLTIVGRETLGGRRDMRTAAPTVPSSASARTLRAPAPRRFTLVLPAQTEPERARLIALVDRLIADLERATDRRTPATLRVVVHPSPQSFQRETGEPWWSAARTRGDRIDLLPVSVLRGRGTLEGTLRHELAHVLTAGALVECAAWAREGVAMHFAGEPPPQSLVDADGRVRRVRCPSDRDLHSAVSAAAARQAYGLAAACVARAIQQGQRWNEIGC